MTEHSRLAHAGLWLRTVRYLRPAQVCHRVRLRAQKVVLSRFGPHLESLMRRPVPSILGWPPDFTPIDSHLAEGFPSSEANAGGVFFFLNEERKLGDPPDWEQADAAQLWQYHLHYFEWAWAFNAQPDREWASSEFRRLWRSWRAGTRFGRWDAWSPYAASLRVWVLCGVFDRLVRGTEDEGSYLDDLALAAGFLRANVEFDVGGNHLIKNIKAIIGAGLFLNDAALYRFGVEHLDRQLTVQILPDGGHYELSPSYHCQVLGDLLDVRRLIEANGSTPSTTLCDAVLRMREWLGAMLLPDGDVPLFNDCVLVGQERLAALDPVPPDPAKRLVVLPDSGYVVARPGPRLHLVADVGQPCPPGLPAHAHADCLSFELCVDGQRVVVDSGTSTYVAGARRQLERSTAGHNTVTIDGESQTEVWGVFRAGRRSRAVLEETTVCDGSVRFRASHDGYARLPGSPHHRRIWDLTESSIEITDEVAGTGEHEVRARLQIAGAVEPGPGGTLQCPSVNISSRGPESLAASTQEAFGGSGFGRLARLHVLDVSVTDRLPVRIVTALALNDVSVMSPGGAA